MRLKTVLIQIKIFFFILFLLGLGAFFVLPYFAPFRSEVGRLFHKMGQGIQSTHQSVVDKAQWRLKEVDVLGTVHTKRADWVQALDLQKDQSMTQVDLDQIYERFMHLPWVKSVVVARYLPDTLRIYVTEKTPVALWQNQGQYRPLDEYGQMIEDASFTSNEILLVVGSDAPKHTLALLRGLDKTPTVASHIQSATRVEGRRWNLYTRDQVKILLPQTDMEKALMRLEHKNSQEQLLKKEVASIDMRTEGKIRLALHPKKVSPQKKAKK